MAELKSLTRKRAAVKSRVTSFRNNIQGISATLDAQVFDSADTEIFMQQRILLNDRIENILGALTEYDNYQSAILDLVDDNDFEAALEDRATFETKFYDQVSFAKGLLQKMDTMLGNSGVHIETRSGGPGYSDVLDTVQESRVNTDGSSNHTEHALESNHIKMPEWRLPSFDGTDGKWSLFYETFKTTVHENTKIPNIKKFQYLTGSLEGKAAQVIQGLPLTSANYEIAWSLIEERYENRNARIHNHIKNIIELPKINKESFVSLRQLVDNLQINYRALKALREPVEHWDSLLIFIINEKLDFYSKREWERYAIDEKGDITFKQFIDYLERRCRLLEKIDKTTKVVNDQNQSRNQKQNQSKPLRTSNSSYSHAATIAPKQCPVCNGQHELYSCPNFLALSITSRIEEIKKQKRCINCLRSNHFIVNCKSNKRCRTCNKKHNSLLHHEAPSDREEGATQNHDQATVVNHCNQIQSCHVLPTATIKIMGKSGKLYECTALLDSGSQSNFITASLCRKLNLPIQRVNVPVVGVSGSTTHIFERITSMIHSSHDDYKAELSLMVIPTITTQLPSERLNLDALKLPENIPLADPHFYNPKHIDILIGVDLFWSLLCLERSIHPCLHKTKLGYVVSGRIGQIHHHSPVTCNLSTLDLSNQLKQFWEIEDCGKERPRSVEEEACELHFIENTKRDENGRFIVSMPIKGNLDSLGDSRATAERRFKLLEKRFKGNDLLKESYSDFIKEYISLGHMTQIKQDLSNQPHCFLPHHGVLKESSTTTKLRVVFDASAPTSSGVSLNDLQMVGPTLQPELLSILLQFRLHKFVIGADIKMMYRQVLVDVKHRLLQLILWRFDPSDELGVWALNTVTYGESASPFLAIRCLFELAAEIKVTEPEVAHLIENMYVDDFLRSFSNKPSAIIDVRKLTHILSSGGFELRKWVSNDSEILKTFQSSEHTNDLVKIGQNEITKTLGLSWISSQDRLIYEVNSTNISKVATKRVVLSLIARIFDPLGLLGPCIIIAKIILQELWKLKASWDDPLPTELNIKWDRFLNQLTYLNSLRIVRQVCHSENDNELHIFSDASKVAYGACVYMRSTTSSGEIIVNLICAKSRVAPLPTKGTKTITIPRLELCAALTGARLFAKVRESLSEIDYQTFFWCDSTIVLGYLKKDPARLSEFVGHRVSEIQETTIQGEWRHVVSRDNPADLLSRGVNPNQLADSKLWWNGPAWLSSDKSTWPHNDYIIPTLPEVKTNISVINEPTSSVIDFERYSDYNHLTRLVAWCFRFSQNAKGLRENRRLGPLTQTEITKANITLARLAQRESFPEEIKLLSSLKHLNPNHKLSKLTPFIHTDGLLRVGGRLSRAEFEFDRRHPVILTAKHPFTRMLFRREHERLLHAGPQALLASTRDRYWTISGRNLARITVHKCITCFRHNPKSNQPMMGNLPVERITPVTPFHVTGVDYAGPILIKDRKGRNAKSTKGYICLFICFATKAVHLELVSDLSTDAFILALRRFASRRGMPAKMNSDNGLNFVGAHNELRELGNFLKNNENELTERLVHESFNWSFIPAYSPHFGGLWEAGVKSAKHHLKRVMGNAQLTFEELTTTLTQIEAILNSRPLTPLSSNAIDCAPLTPGHFLAGKPLTSVPDPDVTHIPEGRLSDYQRVQQMRQHFWKRWSQEYVSELQCRSKWKRNDQSLQEGTLAVIKDPNAPPMKWLLGRVVKVYPGKDGITRVAELRTRKGVIRRPAVRLCPLPIQLEDSLRSISQGGEHV